MAIRPLPETVISSLRSDVTVASVSQCVTELVLNSIDAGATVVSVRVDFRKFKLQVVDNGCGLSSADLEILGTRYMTSKCQSLRDLHNNLSYYGFRGEAICSIIEVSGTLRIVSRAMGCDESFCKVFTQGVAQQVGKSRNPLASPGTTITIADFLYNRPVRRAWIKPALDLEEVKKSIECIALINPNVSFLLQDDVTHDVVLQTSKTGDVRKTFEILFGSYLSSNLVPIKETLGPFKLNGFIATKAHPLKNFQFVYLNRRLLLKTKLHKLINSLMSRSSILKTNNVPHVPISKEWNHSTFLAFSPPKREKYAVFLICISCPYSAYDITHDPKKTLVEFSDWDTVLCCVENGLRSFIEGAAKEANVENCDESEVMRQENRTSVIDEINNLARECASGMSRSETNSDEIGVKCISTAIHGQCASRSFVNFSSKNSDTLLYLNSEIPCSLSSMTSQHQEAQTSLSYSVLTENPYSKTLEGHESSIHSVGSLSSAHSIPSSETWSENASGKLTKLGGNKCVTFDSLSLAPLRKCFDRKRVYFEENFDRLAKESKVFEDEKKSSSIDSPINAAVSIKEIRRKKLLKNLERFSYEVAQEKAFLRTRLVSSDHDQKGRSLIHNPEIKGNDPFSGEHTKQAEKSHTLNGIVHAQENPEKQVDYQEVPSNDSDSASKETHTVLRNQTTFGNCQKTHIENLNGVTGSCSRSSRPKVIFSSPSPHQVYSATKCRNPEEKSEDVSSSSQLPPQCGSFINCEPFTEPSQNLLYSFENRYPTARESTGTMSDYYESSFLQEQEPKSKLVDYSSSSSSSFSQEFEPISIPESEEPVNDPFRKRGHESEESDHLIKKKLCPSNCGNHDLSSQVNENQKNVDSSFCEPSLPNVPSRDEALQEDKQPLVEPYKQANETSFHASGKEYTCLDFHKLYDSQSTHFTLISSAKGDISSPESSKLVSSDPLGGISNEDDDWCEERDEVGREFYIHRKSGITVYNKPKVDAVGTFEANDRFPFIPKGMSPVVQERVYHRADTVNTLYLEKRESLLSLEPTSRGNEDLASIKWGTQNSEISQWPLLDRLLSECGGNPGNITTESQVSSITLQDVPNSDVKVYNALHPHTFSRDIFKNLMVIGQLDKKFIVTIVRAVAEEQVIVLFDQHAVHERIRVESLTKEYQEQGGHGKWRSAPLEPALPLALSSLEVRILSSYQEKVNELGLSFDVIDSNTILIQKVPICLLLRENRECISRGTSVLRHHLESLIREEVDSLLNTRGVGTHQPSIIYNVISSEACRGAFKFGDTLSLVDCEALLHNLSMCSLPFQCAHGRPALVPILDVYKLKKPCVKTKPNLQNLRRNLKLL